jgi:DNA-binding XRE family transcriptional regulator/mannose-6-phosphate isomerase-like protein (cupin superfamily)
VPVSQSKRARTTRSTRKRAPAQRPGIGAAILRLRRARGYTLDDFAARSGISKSMLSQIERDRTNPTVGTLWRIADALEVGINSLLAPAQPADAVAVHPGYSMPAFSSADGRMHWRVLGPVGLAGRFEWYELRADPHSETASEPHEAGAIEHLTVLDGELAVTSGEHACRVAAGATARYRADVRHVIRNDGAAPAHALIVVTHGS